MSFISGFSTGIKTSGNRGKETPLPKPPPLVTIWLMKGDAAMTPYQLDERQWAALRARLKPPGFLFIMVTLAVGSACIVGVIVYGMLKVAPGPH